MEKNKLTRFITKYNLAGASESVELEVEKGKLSTRFAGDDLNCIGFVSTEGVDLEDGKYRIMYTAGLVKLLAVLGEHITVSVKKIDKHPVALTFSDGRNKVTFALSELTPTVPEIEQLPAWDVVIPLDAALMESYVRAKSAMNDVTVFTVLSDGKKVELGLGHSEDSNSNSVILSTEATKINKIRPINFSSKYLRDVIAANKEASGGTLSVSEEGVAYITFDVPDYKAEYWIMEIE